MHCCVDCGCHFRNNVYIITLYINALWAGIATRYGLDGPGIKSRWGRDFSAPVLTNPGAHPASYTMGTGVKRPGCGVNHPLQSSVEVKEREELYLCSLSGSSWSL
jgi:hypothetical protein